MELGLPFPIELLCPWGGKWVTLANLADGYTYIRPLTLLYAFLLETCQDLGMLLPYSGKK